MSLVAILSFAGAKVLLFFEPTKFFLNFFQKTLTSHLSPLTSYSGFQPWAFNSNS